MTYGNPKYPDSPNGNCEDSDSMHDCEAHSVCIHDCGDACHTQINDGGPAFPNVWEDNPSQGMSLRDYWAGQAINGELATLPATHNITAEGLAKWGFMVADAMLAARNAA